jgi:hypothetical protein
MKNETFISTFDVFENGRKAVNPAKLRALREALFALRQQIRRRIDRGLPAAEIAAARSLLTAAQSAENVVESLSA